MSFGSGACSAIKGALPSRGRPYAIFALLFGAACLLVLGVATAQAPAAPPQGSTPLADEEPITAIPPPPAADPLKVALGEQLFGDRRLSHNGNFACLSCHDTRTNGTSSAKPSPNHLRTPSVFDAALSFRLNWEGNFRTLEAHTESSLENPANLATSASEVVEKLKADPEMTRRFSDAYGRLARSGKPARRHRDLCPVSAHAGKPLRPLARRRRFSPLARRAGGLSAFQIVRMRLLPSGRQRRRQSLRASRHFSSARFAEA